MTISPMMRAMRAEIAEELDLKLMHLAEAQVALSKTLNARNVAQEALRPFRDLGELLGDYARQRQAALPNSLRRRLGQEELEAVRQLRGDETKSRLALENITFEVADLREALEWLDVLELEVGSPEAPNQDAGPSGSASQAEV